MYPMDNGHGLDLAGKIIISQRIAVRMIFRPKKLETDIKIFLYV